MNTPMISEARFRQFFPANKRGQTAMRGARGEAVEQLPRRALPSAAARRGAAAVLLMTIIVLLGRTVRSPAAITTTSDDLWDISRGAVVTGHSPVLNWGGYYVSDIRNLFGHVSTGRVEPTETIFGDARKGFVHWVEWETPAPITLRSFVMDAGHDSAGGTRDANARGFSRFTLYARSETTGAFDVLFELFPGNPYSTTVAPPNSVIESPWSSSFFIAANVTPTVARHFRAEFVQYGDTIRSALGPRVRELDGFDTFYPIPVPEPSSLALAAVAACVAGLGRCAQRLRRAAGPSRRIGRKSSSSPGGA